MTFPAPHPRETIASYGYRIAKLSGLSGLPELAHLFDLDLRALLMGDPLSLKRLAEYTGCDPQMLAHGALDASNPHRLQLGADRRNRVRCCPHSFRFCPACVEGLADGDLRTACLGRTDWLVDANHVCAWHGIRLVTISPHKTARVHRDLSPMIPRLLAAQAMPWQASQPTRLERYLAERLDGVHTKRWIDGVQLDVAVHTAEVFGAMAMRGPKADWKGISSEERREHGHVGAEVLVEGPAAIKDFLRQHVGRGRLGNDYHIAFGRAFNEFYFRKDQPAYRPICAVLAEYVGETFRFTGQEKVFGIRTRGVEPKTLRSLCERHGIGLKITAQVLKDQYGIWRCASHEVDPDLIARLAPKLKGLLNTRDAARHLGTSIDVFRGTGPRRASGSRLSVQRQDGWLFLNDPRRFHQRVVRRGQDIWKAKRRGSYTHFDRCTREQGAGFATSDCGQGCREGPVSGSPEMRAGGVGYQQFSCCGIGGMCQVPCEGGLISSVVCWPLDLGRVALDMRARVPYRKVLPLVI